MTNLNSITTKIDKGQGTVGQLINDDSFLKAPSSPCKSSTRPPKAWKTPAP
jgi:hypothetical protein